MWPIFLLETHCLNNFCSLSWPPSIYVIDKVICNLVYKFSLNTILHLYTALEESLSRCTSMFDTKKHTNVWRKIFIGDTRIWTMDLSDCSRLLYHWAISPCHATPSIVWHIFVETGWWNFCHMWTSLLTKRLFVSCVLRCKICRDQDSNLGYCGHNAGS